MRNRDRAWARRMRVIATTAAFIGGLAVTAHAAPIGIPAATTGAGKTALGGEINVVINRDLSGPGNPEAEGSQFVAKGSIGLDERVDLDVRLGFGDFKVDAANLDSDIGPAFGAGVRITWANIPQSNLKIGSVFQTLRIRAEDNTSGTRQSWAEYDAALGAAIDLAGSGDPKQKGQLGLVPYGGLAWSGLDLSGTPSEDDAFGIFLGLGVKAQGNLLLGAELRLIDQSALSVNASMAF